MVIDNYQSINNIIKIKKQWREKKIHKYKREQRGGKKEQKVILFYFFALTHFFLFNRKRECSLSDRVFPGMT